MRLIQMYFSPSHTTKRSVEAIGSVFADKMQIQAETIDLTKTNFRLKKYAFTEEDIVVCGAPVYSGRIPPLLLPVFENIQGNGARAIVCAVYGNCNLGDALLEISDIFTRQNFRVYAAAELIGEHSYTEQVAKNRPDAEDIQKCKNFACEAYGKVCAGELLSDLLPGNFPYKKYGSSLTTAHTAPLINPEKCTNCKICTEVCPVGNLDEQLHDLGHCISCAACVKLCPEGARYFSEPSIVAAQTTLAEKFSARREPKFYL